MRSRPATYERQGARWHAPPRPLEPSRLYCASCVLLVDGAAEDDALGWSDAAFDGMLVGVASCAGAAGSAAGGGVIACDADGVLGCEAIGAEGAGVTGSVLDDVAVSELDDMSATGSLAARRLLRVDAVTLFVERDASREGFAFDAGAASTSFVSRFSLVDGVDFAGSGVDVGDSVAGVAGFRFD